MSMKKMCAVAAAVALAATAAPAFAANPFSDVPLNHWAYDAVDELTAKGILEGYPDGTFRGNRAMTRYEIAIMVARMTNVDMSDADVDKLKALVTEFAPELEALGVKVDGFDSRLTSLEKGLSGWKLSGEMQFDFNAYDKAFEGEGDGFEFDSARLFLHRDLDNGLSFDAEFSGNTFDRFWLTAEDFLGWEGFTMKAGQFDIDYEGEDGLYYEEHEDGGFFQGLPYRGFELNKSFGLAEVDLFGASHVGDDDEPVYNANQSGEYYGARLKINFNEKTWLSGNYYVAKPGDDAPIDGGDFSSFWIAAGFKFSDGIELKGAYYWQDLEDDNVAFKGVDDPKAYKVILSLDQDALRFTSLWAEYAHFDKGFVMDNVPYAFHSYVGGAIGDSGLLSPTQDDTDVMFFALRQEWTEKWSTFERYHQYDMDNYGKLKDFAVGIGYQYSPSLAFELSYNRVKGDDTFTSFEEKGEIVRFRTLLSF